MLSMDESTAEGVRLPESQIVLVIKGREQTSEGMLSRELAKYLNLLGHDCSLFRYDDVRASIQESLGSNLTTDKDCELLDDLACQILLEVASNDFYIDGEMKPRSIVLDYLSLRSQIDRALRLWMHVPLAEPPLFIVVECGPCDESEDYCKDSIPRLTVDTSDSIKSANDHAKDVINWISSYARRLKEEEEWGKRGDLPISTIDEGAGSCQQGTQRHFSHHHPLFSYPDYVAESSNDETATATCILCKETVSGPSYSCTECDVYLHKSCAELPRKIRFGGKEFLLGPTGTCDEYDVPGECIVCYGSSGVLYSFDEYPPRHVHPKCAELPYKLKHSCHQHDLKLKVITFAYICFACGVYGHFIGYNCKECRIYFHVTCTLHLEVSVSHKRHWHPFRLCTIPRDETNEYYCEICAGERHPDLWAYHCTPCGYEAHLSCVNPRVKPCDPIVLLPQFRRVGMLRLLKPWPSDVLDKRHPPLSEISGSQLAWKPVDVEEESESGSDPDVPRHS